MIQDKMRNASAPHFPRECGGVFSKALFLVVFALALLAVRPAGAGLLYVAERRNGNLDLIDTETGEGRAVASGLGGLVGVAADRQGRVFVSRLDAGTVALVDPEKGTFVDIASGFDRPHCLFADPRSDTLYLAGYAAGVVYRLKETSPGSWSTDIEAGGLSVPIAVYLIGDLLYITDEGDSKLYFTKVGTGVVEEFLTLPLRGQSIDREVGGDLIIGTYATPGVVCRVRLEARQIVRTYEGFALPSGLVVDPADNSALVCEHDGHRITRLNLETDERTVVTTFVDTPHQPAWAHISVDCNQNSIPDWTDIKEGTSGDCNRNGVPDECDLGQGTALDCNGNSIPDSCEIASGALADANRDGIPDSCQAGGTRFLRADANSDGKGDISDAIFALVYLFRSGPAPTCLDAADINDDGKVNISDPIYLLVYLFAGGMKPTEPFAACGPDPTEHALGCESFPQC